MHQQVRMTMTPRPFFETAAARAPTIVAALAALAALLASTPAHASFLSGEVLDKAANVIALVVIFVVPIVLIAVFWMVHVLPEKIAHKRHHPQQEAIQVLCLLSLVFGGLLWPLAWLWAYSKPVMYKLAYGTDKAEGGHTEGTRRLGEEGRDLRADVARLRADLEKIVSQGGAPDELTRIRDQLAALEPQLAAKAKEAR
jgi:CBS domain containing-hemolysin-like protein